MRILHECFQVGFIEGFDPRRQRTVAKHEYGRTVFTRDSCCFQGYIKEILDGGRRENNPRAVAMAAENGLVEIALFDICRKSCAWSSTLDIHNEKGDLGHRRPADCFGLQRDAGAGTTGDRKIPRIGETERKGDRSQLVLCLDKKSTVFRQLR